MSEKDIRAKSALERTWVRFGEFSYVCGEWTATRFTVGQEEKIVLYFGQHERVGIFGSFEEAFGDARKAMEKAA